MPENRLVQTGTVGGVPVYADALHLGGAHDVVIGDTDYIAIQPPGWPVRPQNRGSATPEGSTFTFTAGSTVSLLKCEAEALVTGGFATYA